MRSAAPLVVVCLAGLGVMLPMLLLPYAARGDDFLHHILRLITFDQQVHWGDAFPLRFPGYGHGYGLATLSYYPPLAYLLMETARLLGANYLHAYQAAFVIAALGAGLSSYYLGTRLFNRAAAVVVSVAYIYSPYFLTDVWSRAAVTEALALAAVPFLFAAIDRVMTEAGWRGYVEISLAAALTVVAHPLSSFYFAPFVGLWVLLSIILADGRRRWRGVLILATGALTGALLTSFYWLPLQIESAARRSIDLSVALHDFVEGLKPVGQVVRVSLTMVFRAGETVPDFSVAVPLLVAIALIYFFFTLKRRRFKAKAQYIFFALSTMLAFLAMTTWSRPLWESVALVSYLQFPFRWFGPLALFTALIIGGSLDVVGAPCRPDRWYRVAVGGILVFLVITSLVNAPDAPAQLLAVGTTKLTAEDFATPGLLQAYEHNEEDYYATHGCWVWSDRLVPSTSFLSDCPRYLATMLEDAPVQSTMPPIEARVTPTRAGPNILEAQVNSPTPWQLSLHAFWIPGWSAVVDGQPVKVAPTDAIGLAGVMIPAGEHEVRLAFGATPLRRAAVWVSLLMLAGWLVFAWWRHWRLAAGVTLALLLMAGLIGGRALAAPKLPTLTPVQIDFGGKIGLEGYAFGRQGDMVDVRLLWLARQPMEESYKVFIHVINDQGNLLAQVDSRPLNYADNTNRWLPGQVTYDQFEVPLPAEMPPGRYQVRVGLYNEADGQRLPVLDASGQAVDNQVLLGEVTVP